MYILNVIENIMKTRASRQYVWPIYECVCVNESIDFISAVVIKAVVKKELSAFNMKWNV